MAVFEQKANTTVGQNTLLHWETLLVITASDLEDIALPLVADGVTKHLSAHAFIEEWAELALIFDFYQLLAASGRI